MAARLTAFVVVAIVAVTLIAGLIVGAQRDDSDGPVDVIVHNARVYTADTAGRTAEAVAIRGNQILRVGTDREISRLKRPQTTMIDAQAARPSCPGSTTPRSIWWGVARPAIESTCSTHRPWTMSNIACASGRRRIRISPGCSAAGGSASCSPTAGPRASCSIGWCRTGQRGS